MTIIILICSFCFTSSEKKFIIRFTLSTLHYFFFAFISITITFSLSMANAEFEIILKLVVLFSYDQQHKRKSKIASQFSFWFPTKNNHFDFFCHFWTRYLQQVFFQRAFCSLSVKWCIKLSSEHFFSKKIFKNLDLPFKF